MQKKINFLNNLNTSKQLYIFMLMAFTFSVCARLYWVFWASGYPMFFYNDTLMISTNDGYAFAEGARDMLAGFHQENDLSYFGSSLSTLTYYFVKITGIKLEVAMLYMSVLFGSLIVIPILLISKEYMNLKLGFFAAIIASIADSYYNRTMAGYYDTDMLTIVLPVFVIWGLLRVLEKKDKKDIIIAPIFILIYNWWYLSGFSLLISTIGLFLFYVILFDRKNILFYFQFGLLILSISNFNFYIKFIAILLAYICYLKYESRISIKILDLFLIVCIVIFIACGGLNPIWFQFKFYFFRDISEISDLSFKFFNVNQTIQESGIVDFTTFFNRISGHTITFFVSLIGFVWMCFRHRSFCITIAMLFLGFLALKGGLRFTIYAVPIMALGLGFFVVNFLKVLKLKSIIQYNILYIVFLFFAVFPIQNHIKEYLMTPVFTQNEVETLDKLKKIASRDDYVLAWWDYGYPIRYYSDVKTLIDGGKHLGKDNFAVSFALSQDQISSANMARLEVEYTERNFKEHFGVNLAQMMRDYNTTNANKFLFDIGDDNFNPPKKSREIYYYLPDRMMYIFPTMLHFSKLDLMTGKEFPSNLYEISEKVYEDPRGIGLAGTNIVISSGFDNLFVGDNTFGINTFIETKKDENDKLVVSAIENDKNSELYVIFMRDYARFLILDRSMFESTFIQLFVLENYNKDIFEPVILNNDVKIYRLKK
ncbi:undecaprenyl-diphosphooligosaccharide--protein glycotransferase [Campylobacter pinnipediorum subsp. caledonicus]|uniref:Undecaprenyl-diphosphooligosaccharide--protein glycotransferase n=1 Tax=Campylobacter pinnipediorum subsp. caledonicus TaxID=1874362 RepID=A0A1S6U7E6_9BACT|nr:STT3 domain-containing protein [Campylobacter pinnipediorum]AQW87674.1 undecaprenyl-diphosphooligosaccharide--protein glycotransferase [Campylobacter pinnipediorum subsp. caledonicus]